MAGVRIITTGGTIASLPRENGDLTAALQGEALVRRLGVDCSVDIYSCVTIGSFAFDYDTLRQVAVDVLLAIQSPNVTGVVVTHGTDTLEETAFFLSLVAGGSNKPIVLTGAQLDASHPQSDGYRNLKDAICVATAKNANTLGVVVVFSGFVYSAREVRKVDTSAFEAFSSPGWGPVGRVDGERVYASRFIEERPVIPLATPQPVALIRLGIGMTGEELRGMVLGYRGIVIQAFGRGNAHPSIFPEVETFIRNGIPVVITSRCIRGAVMPLYGNGGGRDLERAGAWFAGDLSGEKARLLLGLLLANSYSCETMKESIEAWSTP